MAPAMSKGRQPLAEEIGNHRSTLDAIIGRRQLLQGEATQMPYAVSQGVRIHYQIEGDGEPLVLQHGFTDAWRRGTSKDISKG
jgi:hypothetical protein